jgi:signal transduction histidine kinase
MPGDLDAAWTTPSSSQDRGLASIRPNTNSIAKGTDTVGAVRVLLRRWAALENHRLTAEMQVELAEIRASRSRIVAVADAERRCLERDLHDGAQQRLVIAALSLRQALQCLEGSPQSVPRTLLADSAENLDAAIRELRDLARGVRPAILTDAGLVPALMALAERTPLDAQVTAPALPRLSPAAEAAGYFVVNEALTNTLKHAHAKHVRITVEYVKSGTGGLVRLEITDDGVGGAQTSGSGLLGLHDRVSALNGKLTVHSIVGQGTTISAVIPCGTTH